jgi:S1/P1 Nuclease
MRLLLLLLVFLPAAACALGPEGHRVVGDIASQHLSPAARAAVARLLRHDRLADRAYSNRTTLGEIASWPDEIKDFKWGKVRGTWHYDDIPVCEAPDPLRYCKVNCASKRLEEQIALLGDAAAPLHRRNEALKWVVHLIGDIHQPLHAADNHDNGGNRVEVSFFGERDNPPYGTIKLHAIWDIHIVRRLLAEQGGEAQFLAVPIAAADKAAWERGSIANWMAESHELAKSVVYGNLPGGFACGRKVTGVLAIDEEYYAKAAPVLGVQMRKAGIRLAKVLNDALAP